MSLTLESALRYGVFLEEGWCWRPEIWVCSMGKPSCVVHVKVPDVAMSEGKISFLECGDFQ